MRRKRKGGQFENFSLSFLDVICCGFGGIILLLVLTKIGEPRALEAIRSELEGLVAKLQEELFELRGETNVFERDLRTRVEQLSEEREKIARLRGDLSSIQGEFAATEQLSEVNDIVEGRLLAAQQALTEEMQRLLGKSYRRSETDATIGGVPVDSEYIVFIIDTSGSMHNYAWPLVLQKMQEVLAVYPRVKGIQVMNDEGQYMFSNYARKWIPDTPGRRRIILDRLRGWAPFSNSSPVEGIERAIRAFAAPDKKISLYVLGDEFTGDSIEEVVETVDRINRRGRDGQRLVRIHAIGFPVMFSRIGFQENTGVRFATLMRILCRENGGAFVGLTSIRP
ncbi:MAG TPA: VWA domain-containing protein [Vicinamibacteria bacterium]|nr:VWA domain-containing protein [Vicinamibacteria bacterium]